jgi:hypothetical protein
MLLLVSLYGSLDSSTEQSEPPEHVPERDKSIVGSSIHDDAKWPSRRWLLSSRATCVFPPDLSAAMQDTNLITTRYCIRILPNTSVRKRPQIRLSKTPIRVALHEVSLPPTICRDASSLRTHTHCLITMNWRVSMPKRSCSVRLSGSAVPGPTQAFPQIPCVNVAVGLNNRILNNSTYVARPLPSEQMH